MGKVISFNVSYATSVTPVVKAFTTESQRHGGSKNGKLDYIHRRVGEANLTADFYKLYVPSPFRDQAHGWLAHPIRVVEAFAPA